MEHARIGCIALALGALLCLPTALFGFGSGLAVCTPPLQPKPLIDPAVLTSCTEAELRAALLDGGHITFDCGPQPVTIPIDSTLELSTAVDTLLDGGGLVTLDGQNRTRLFHKGWHDNYAITITFQNIRVINGVAPTATEHSGGVFYGGHPGTRVHVINSTFAHNRTTALNTADNQGGAFFVHNSYETIISGSEFIDNRAGNGGAFGGIATGLLVFNSTFTGNEAVDTSTDGIVKGHGGAIHLDGVTNTYNPDSNRRLHVCGSLFDANTSVRGGGALKVTVSDNKGTRATYEKSIFLNNRATGTSGIEGHGGAIYHIEDDHAGGSSELNVELQENIFRGNSGWKQGGGAWLSVLGRGEIINNTFVDNETSFKPDNGMGGGLCLSLGNFKVLNNTLARNYAWFHGGGIQASTSATMTLQNNLFYRNESERVWACYQTNRAADADGGGNLQYPPDRYNQSGGVDDCPVSASVLIADPQPGEPAGNGGPTQTMALAAGSPAIDSGAGLGAPDTDQRGFERDAACDIGAYEYGGRAEISLTDVILILKICSGLLPDNGGSLPPDINGDNRLGMEEAIYGLQALTAP